MAEPPKPPDPYDAARTFALSLERQGIGPEQICDAMMVTAINAASRLNGPEAVALTLRDMAEMVTWEYLEERPTTH